MSVQGLSARMRVVLSLVQLSFYLSDTSVFLGPKKHVLVFDLLLFNSKQAEVR